MIVVGSASEALAADTTTVSGANGTAATAAPASVNTDASVAVTGTETQAAPARPPPAMTTSS